MQEFTLRITELTDKWRVEVHSKAEYRSIEASVDGNLLSALTNCLPAIVDNCVEDFPWSEIDGRSK